MIQIIIQIIIVALIVGFISLEVLTLRRWQGWWRRLAALPPIALVVMILNIVIGVLRDKTAHNLWPLEIVAYVAGGFVYLVVLMLLNRILKKRV
jgi:hypothetical protein